MNRVALILPYFGEFPSYFNLWIKSASYNSGIDFIIITDHKLSYEIPKNIHVYLTTFSAVKKRTQKVLDFKVKLNKPYKLCDYRPMYGLIFRKIIKNYEFWGHCDPDIIWGNLQNFITDSVLDENWRIYSRGHLTLYRNNKTMNYMFKRKKDLIINYIDVCTTDYSCHFDEWSIWNKVLESDGVKVYDHIDYADIRCDKYKFLLFDDKSKDVHQIFEWNKGELLRYFIKDDNICTDKWAYIHLQKRNMKYEVSDKDKFLIVPNKFINYQKINIDFVKEYSRNKIWIERIRKRTKEIQVNIKNGSLKYRCLYLIRKKFK